MLRKKNGDWYPFVNLAGIHLFPTLIVFLGLIPTYFVLTRDNAPVNWLDYVAFAAGIIATTIELVADEQMRIFIRNPENKGVTMDKGLWKYSRHPNYFGEVLFWVSLFLFAYAASPDYLWTVVGSVAMLALFIFISIPMMDDRSLERRPGFKDYMERTSGFLLLPPKSKK